MLVGVNLCYVLTNRAVVIYHHIKDTRPNEREVKAMKKVINFPSIRVEANYVFGDVAHYSLYINNEYDGTYITKEDLQHKLLLVQITELNRELNKV